MNSDVPTSDETSEELHRQLAQFRRQQAARPLPDVLIGFSPAIVRARTQVEVAARSGANALIQGHAPSELAEVAYRIHSVAHPEGQASLARFDATLMRSDDLRRLLAGSSHGHGTAPLTTLLLERVEQLSPALQANLLGVLKSHTHTQQPLQLLATRCTSFATATSQPSDSPAVLSDELYSLLSTLTITLPPLSERPEDIPVLAQWLVDQQHESALQPISGISDEAFDLLILYDWPGQTAELRDALETASRHCQERCQECGRERTHGYVLEASDLPPLVHQAVAQAQLATSPPEPIDLDAYLRDVESLLIDRALELAAGNKAEAARLLGISRPRLYRRLEQLGRLEPASSASERPPTAPEASRPATFPPTTEPAATPVGTPGEAEPIEFVPLDTDPVEAETTPQPTQLTQQPVEEAPQPAEEEPRR